MGFGLSSAEAGLLRAPYPDFGQVYYLVDSDRRTIAQGWSRPDRTGPLDLIEAKRAPAGVQYVYRTGDYASDLLTAQAAIDAQIDFRGDTLFWTPGDYTITGTLSVDVPGARWLGRRMGDGFGHPSAAHTNITMGATSELLATTAADDMEVAYLRFIPRTALNIWTVAGTNIGGYFHHLVYDSTGVTASTATRFMLMTGAATDWVWEKCTQITDGAQGAFLELDASALRLKILDWHHFHMAGTQAIGLLDVDGAGARGILIDNWRGMVHGTTGAVTGLVDLVDLTSALTNVTVCNGRGSVGYATATTLITEVGVTAEVDLCENRIATVLGGTGSTLYTG